ncbi:MAG: hypothetical protein DRP09_12495 [Candidatus Thorarchaeota archaeon]|nr:MAG: hypothetical protein DRP09_12495 [Candidatus Thorarchaeota archaeon]
MFGDPDLQKLAVESRQRLVQEFAETYADLRERVKRVPDAEAQRISETYSCPLEIAMVAYIISMDSIMSEREAVALMASELERRSEVGEAVPNLPGNVMEFALLEGRWLSHLYGQFNRTIEKQVRNLANEEGSFSSDDVGVERALSIIAARTKLAETAILPVVDEWLKDHVKSTSSDVLTAFGLAVTRWNPNTLNGRLLHIQRRNQALFRMLRQALTKASDSFTIDASIARIDQLISELEQPPEDMTPRAVSHLLLHIVPRQTSGRGDKSQYVSVGTASTRGNKAEPDMSSPFDFLERDVKLAKRRKGDERESYLKERIARVIKVLKYEDHTVIDCIEMCLKELQDRFDLQDILLDNILNSNKDLIREAPAAERDLMAVNMVYEFITKSIYGEEDTAE